MRRLIYAAFLALFFLTGALPLSARAEPFSLNVCWVNPPDDSRNAMLKAVLEGASDLKFFRRFQPKDRCIAPFNSVSWRTNPEEVMLITLESRSHGMPDDYVTRLSGHVLRWENNRWTYLFSLPDILSLPGMNGYGGSISSILMKDTPVIMSVIYVKLEDGKEAYYQAMLKLDQANRAVRTVFNTRIGENECSGCRIKAGTVRFEGDTMSLFYQRKHGKDVLEERLLGRWRIGDQSFSPQ